MTTRESLHARIDVLPDGVLEQVDDLLRDFPVDPVLRALQNAPIDDEPLTQEDEEALAKARESYGRGTWFTQDEVERMLENADRPLDE